MTRPRAYEISSPFGNFKGTVRSIVTAYNNVIENRGLTDAYKDGKARDLTEIEIHLFGQKARPDAWFSIRI